MELLEYRELIEKFGKEAADYIVAERKQWANQGLYVVAQVSPRRYQVMRFAYGSGKNGDQVATYVPSGIATASEGEALKDARRKIENI